jgi:hypothetical protein
MDHTGRELAAGRHAPRPRRVGGVASEGFQLRRDVLSCAPRVRGAGRPGPGRRIRERQDHIDEEDVRGPLGLRHLRSRRQADEHSGVHRHAGTGAGRADGRVRAGVALAICGGRFWIGIKDVEIILAGRARAGANGETAVEQFGDTVTSAAMLASPVAL